MVEVVQDDLVWVPPNVEQYVRNTGDEDLVFLCIVDPPWAATAEQVNQSNP